LVLVLVLVGFCLTADTAETPVVPLCQNIIGYINSARKNRGVRSLKVSPFLNNFSQQQSVSQAKNNCLEVSSKESLDALKLNSYGENVGFLRTKKTSKDVKKAAASTVRGWLYGKDEQSKGHKKNLLNIKF